MFYIRDNVSVPIMKLVYIMELVPTTEERFDKILKFREKTYTK